MEKSSKMETKSAIGFGNLEVISDLSEGCSGGVSEVKLD